MVLLEHSKAPGTSKSAGLRVIQSASLYSMSSGSSNVSGEPHNTNRSIHFIWFVFASSLNVEWIKREWHFLANSHAGISYSSNKSNSSGASCSTSNSGTSGTYSTSSLSSAQCRSHSSGEYTKRCPPPPPYHQSIRNWHMCLLCFLTVVICAGGCLINRIENRRHHDGCGGNCLGAIPRNSQHASCQKPMPPQKGPQILPTYSNKRSLNHYTNKVRMSDINRLPPIKEFRSPTKIPAPSPSKLLATNPRLR